jgi:hypothetical protein
MKYNDPVHYNQSREDLARFRGLWTAARGVGAGITSIGGYVLHPQYGLYGLSMMSFRGPGSLKTIVPENTVKLVGVLEANATIDNLDAVVLDDRSKLEWRGYWAYTSPAASVLGIFYWSGDNICVCPFNTWEVGYRYKNGWNWTPTVS